MKKNANFEQIRRLVVEGRLYELDTIVASHALPDHGSHPQTWSLLQTAVNAGFHSMVKLLLDRCTWPQRAINDSMRRAVLNHRCDLALLLADAGGDVLALEFGFLGEHCCIELMERFIAAGGDPTSRDAFAALLAQTRAKPLLKLLMRARRQVPALEGQVALALAVVVRDATDEQPYERWIGHLLWASADTFMMVPHWIGDRWDAAISDMTSAAEVATGKATPRWLEALHLKPSAEQARDLLAAAAQGNHADTILPFLLKAFPAEINEPCTGHCRALHELLQRTKCPFDGFVTDERKLMRALSVLLSAGGRWRPDARAFRSTRLGLKSFKRCEAFKPDRILRDAEYSGHCVAGLQRRRSDDTWRNPSPSHLKRMAKLPQLAG